MGSMGKAPEPLRMAPKGLRGGVQQSAGNGDMRTQMINN